MMGMCRVGDCGIPIPLEVGDKYRGLIFTDRDARDVTRSSSILYLGSISHLL
jgi:hypothetical protein